MKEQITVYYFKNSRSRNDYIIARVLLQEGETYSITSYYMINGKIKEYPSKLKLSKEKVNMFLLECMKESCFDHIEYQIVMEGI